MAERDIVQKLIEFPRELAEAMDALAKARGETFRAAVLHACRRHLAYPPAPPEPPCEPLPDSPAATAPAPAAPTRKARRRRESRG